MLPNFLHWDHTLEEKLRNYVTQFFAVLDPSPLNNTQSRFGDSLPPIMYLNLSFKGIQARLYPSG